jgi:hypothetical protein
MTKEKSRGFLRSVMYVVREEEIVRGKTHTTRTSSSFLGGCVSDLARFALRRESRCLMVRKLACLFGTRHSDESFGSR